ncbi:MAG: preprotein translocase subunit SecY [Clostridia bacterium]|nr:preprotein translocase subunit SecY [Clostridia bacterium]
MFQTFKNAWKTPELKKKLLFTIMIILLYRIGANLYVPFIDVNEVQNLATYYEGSIFQFVSLLSGDAFSKATFFALSVTPYITASIVMQLLTIAIPALERLSKEGEEGRKKINNYTRFVTVALALVTAYGYVKLLGNYGILTIDKSVDKAGYYFGMAVMVACFCTGAAVIMWLAEKINDHGIGNGISMILFANIISRGAAMVQGLIGMVSSATDAKGYIFGGLKILLSVVLTIAVIGLIVWFTNSERRIPVQYAKRVVGRKMYGGQNSNLPLKMNMAGVMPVIFASSIVSIPATIAGFMSENGFTKWVSTWFNYNSALYIVLFIVLIVLFSYFYIMISFNPVEVSNNIKNQGGSVPGIRPGKPTADYIKKILNRITLLGAIFLIVISGGPLIVGALAPNFQSIAFGGTSLLIVVGVALETAQDLEAQLSMRNYKGFLD